MKPFFVFTLTGFLWITVVIESIPVDIVKVKKPSGKSNTDALIHEPKIVKNKVDADNGASESSGSNVMANVKLNKISNSFANVNGVASANPIKANSIRKAKTVKRKFKAKINYFDDDRALPLKNKISQRKQNRTLDLSDIDEVLSDQLKKKYGEYVKDGYGRNVEELTNIRKKLKILKKMRGTKESAKTVKTNETSTDVDDLLFEGDERLTEAQLDSIIASTARHYGFDMKPLEKYGIKSRRSKRQAVLDPNDNDRLWPQGTINYAFDQNFPAATKKIVRQAFKNIENQTCLSFAESSDTASRIQFANTGSTTRCDAPLGHYNNDPHVVRAAACLTKFGTLSHEILHVLGIHHQQSRSDVEDFLEDTNIKLLNLRYSCMCENPTVTCLNGGYPNPYDCSSCLCPRGYDSSKRCSGVDPGTEGESEEIAVTSDECQTFEKSLGTDDDFSNTYYKKAWLQFKAPSGKRVQLIFLKGADKDESENSGCPDNGIEVKMTKSKFDRTGYIPTNDGIKTFTSSGNMAMLQLFAKKNMIDLTVKYRYVDSANDDIPQSCLPISECENIAGDEDCELYAGNPNDDCENDQEFMLINCAKTCGVC
uniref:Metalloendopeptidase n=1 Tax=Panagrolaimus davidi TaxID=227884 RepID=A0A914Q5P5_9BILA